MNSSRLQPQFSVILRSTLTDGMSGTVAGGDGGGGGGGQRYRWSSVEKRATGTQHNQIVSRGEHFGARLMDHGHYSKTTCCKLFKQLEQRQRATAVEAAGGFVQK